MVKCPHAASGCDYPASECAGHCSVNNGLRQHRPEARRLAKVLEANPIHPQVADLGAAELRRLHAENEDYGSTIDHLTRENAEQIGEIVALKEQRDELLEALQALTHSLDYADLLHDDQRKAFKHARSAIAKGEES